MQDIDWNIVSAAVVAILTGVGIWWNTIKGKKRADGEAPPERPPSPHEMREAVHDLHEHLRKISRKLDSMDDSILVETRHIRDGLREIENWQKLHDARIILRPPH